MRKSILNRILSALLVLVFVFPMSVKLGHIFHEHDEIHLCQATGAEKHIHNKQINDCDYLHKNLLQDQELPSGKVFILVKTVHNEDLVVKVLSKIDTFIPGFSGRAPPICL